MLIPFSLFYIFKRRQDFTYRWMAVLFAIFILGCGLTHVLDVVNIWHPVYRIDSLARIITAIASLSTAIVLIKYTPKILTIPTSRQWRELNEELMAANEELSAANEEYNAANEELQSANEELNAANEQLIAAKAKIEKLSKEKLVLSQAKYQALAESISDIFFALDTSFTITYWNKASENFSGISAEDAIGKYLYELYPQLENTRLAKFYDGVMQSNKADKIIHQFGDEFHHKTYELNAYPTAEGISVINVDVTPLHQAQKEIEEQKKRLELALWAAELGTYERDLVNDTLDCDARYLEITGLNPDAPEPNLRELTKRIHPDDMPMVMESLRLHEEENTPSYKEQYRILDKDGSYKWVMSSAKIVRRAPDGKALRLVGVIQDITEIKHTEESTRFFKYLIDHTDDPVYWIDPYDHFRFVYVNKAACRHYGLSEEKLLQMSLPEWDASFTYEKCQQHWEKIQREKSLNFETTHRNARGEEVPVEISTNYLKYGERELFGGHFKNISERKEQENKIFELQQRLEGIIDSAMDAIITTSEDQHIMIFNKSAEKMFGYASHEIIGQQLSVLIPGRFQNIHQEHVTHFGQSGRSNRKMGSNQAVFGLNATGEEFPIEASISQVKVGAQKYYTVIMRDISLRLQREQQERELNKELIRQNEQLQQFGYITSHNLRSPVASLLGLVEVIDEQELDNPVYAQALQRIQETAEKMDEIIQDLNQILEYQKSVNTQKEWISLESILDSVQVLIAPTIADNQASFLSTLEVREVYTVKSYLQSIFYNLLSNAIKYRSPKRKPEIKVSCRQVDNEIIIEVSDNGLGIDLEKNQTKLFGMYKRFHHHIEGKGIGLHLVKTQVEALNGKIMVSSALDEGTTFTITFPLTEA